MDRMNPPSLVCALLLYAGFATSSLFAGDCRLMLAGQLDWANKLGFYTNLEATTAPDGKCHLDKLTLYLGVADGTAWRYSSFKTEWQYEHRYKVLAIIAPGYADLQVDGVLVEPSFGAFQPYAGALTTNQVPDWASSPAEYPALEGDVTASNSTRSVTVVTPGSNLPLDLLQFSGTMSGSISFSSSASDTQIISTSFVLHRAVDLQADAPFIDRYGQIIQSPYTGKVKSDADLISDDNFESNWLAGHPRRCCYDAWGGMTGAAWSRTPTGFYTTVKQNGYWWLISPDGNPVFYTGISDAPALAWDMTPVTGREWMFAELPARNDPAYPGAWRQNVWSEGGSTDYFAFITANLVRKYGSDWERRATDRTNARIQSWGFSGLGKWSTDVGDLPLLPVVYVYTAPMLVNHIDPFDANSRALFASGLQDQIGARISDKKILGWSFMNEYDGIVTAGEIGAVLAMSSAVPAKRALLDYAVNQLYGGDLAKLASAWGVQAGSLQTLYASAPVPPAGDLEQMRQHYENELHKFIYGAFKHADPNHLYFGFWIVPGWWVNNADWTIAAANCDVLGYDRYAFNLLTPDLTALLGSIDKPTLIGEFSFPPTYDLTRGFGVYAAAYARDDAAAGEAYARWINDAAGEPTTTGVMWFQYRDEPLTGRGPGQGMAPVYGEHYAFGVTDVADRPKYDLVTRMRDANWRAGSKRLLRSTLRPPRRGRTQDSAGTADQGSDRHPADGDHRE
jgi:hypothetical protein